MRVDPVLLEQAYVREPVIFNTINIYSRGILSHRPYLSSTSESDKDKLRNIEERWNLQNQVIPDLVKNMTIYGASFNEIICGKDTGKLMRLDTRDPKWMDISKTGYNTMPVPLVDKLGEPRYYVQYLTNYHMMDKPNMPNLIQQMFKPAIKYEKEDILYINLYTLGDGIEGLGIVEPLYNAVKNKYDVEKATTQAILRLGNPIIYASVGDEKVYPSQAMIDAAGEAFRDIDSKSGFAIPYYIKPEILEPNKPERLTLNLDYYNAQLVTGGGVPRALVTGGGEGANRHTLSEQMDFLEQTFEMIRIRISDAFRKQVLGRVEDTESLRGDITLNWEFTELDKVEDRRESPVFKG